MPAVEFFYGNKIQKPDLQVVEDLIGHVHREHSFAFEHVMEVGLAESCEFCQAAFGGFAALNPAAEVFEEAVFKVDEGQDARPGNIPMRNRVLVNSLRVKIIDYKN